MDVWNDTGRYYLKTMTTHTRGAVGEKNQINQSDRNTIEVVCACSKTTTGTCLRADNGRETTRETEKRGRPRTRWNAVTRDMKVVGLEVKMADDRKRRSISDRCGDHR